MWLHITEYHVEPRFSHGIISQLSLTPFPVKQIMVSCVPSGMADKKDSERKVFSDTGPVCEFTLPIPVQGAPFPHAFGASDGFAVLSGKDATMVDETPLPI